MKRSLLRQKRGGSLLSFRRRQIMKFASGMALSLALILVVIFTFAKPDFANAVPIIGTPNVTVSNETDLTSAIAVAPTNGTQYVIAVSGAISLTSTKTIATGQNIALTGGGTLAGVGNFDDITVDGNLILGDITITHDTGLTGSGVGVAAAGTLYMLGGTTITSNISSTRGGGIYNAGTLNIFGGAISGNTSIGDGGGIYNGGVAVIDGATISGNEAGSTATNGAGGGGGIFSGNSLVVANSIISNNVSSSRGGGIYVPLKSTGVTKFEITNTTISGNKAFDGGGGIYTDFSLTLGQGVIVENNSAGYNGGGGYGGGLQTADGPSTKGPNTPTITLDGAIFRDNHAGGTYAGGGGLYIEDAYFVMNSGEIYGNSSGDVGSTMASGGGIFMSTRPDMKVYGGIIRDNTAIRNGGGIWAGPGPAIIQNVTISSNTAGIGGGGIYVYPTSPSAVSLSGNVVISGNTAARGGGIYNAQTAANPNTVTLAADTTIANNTATGPDTAQGAGGGIYTVRFDKTIVASGVTFFNNKAPTLRTIDLTSTRDIDADGVADLNNYSTQINAVITPTTAADWGQNAIMYNNYDINYPGDAYLAQFVSNGGSAVDSQLIAAGSGDLVIEPANPIRVGYRFAGWFTDDGVFANLYDFGIAVNDNVTLYAKWDALCQWNSLLLASDTKCVKSELVPPPTVPTVPNTGFLSQ